MRPYFFLLIFFVLTSACNTSNTPEFKLSNTKFTLDNGLDVIFHVDRSDPVVAVAMTYHVGSAREVEGRTGFAHLFEHLLFLESENLGKGGLDQLSSRVGGSGANGSTSRDRTNYFQTVPKDALEKMLWAEADKLGYFINTVTEPVLAKEKQVVKNEKRQRVDNQPYGHTGFVIDKNLFPEDHPYSWQVIGSLDDLQNATLQDVKEFYNRWYVPNNATLVVAGDFDEVQAKKWVEKYFGEIPKGEEIKPLEKRRAVLAEDKRLFHEDNFARLPQLARAWPVVEQYHPDAHPLTLLAQLLGDGKKSPFYKVLVEEKKLTSNVSIFNQTSELAGTFRLGVSAYPNTPLDDVDAAISEAFERFETEGFSEKDLDRIKSGLETQFYNRLTGVLGKAFELAQYNIFAGDPNYITKDINQLLNVTKDDILRVYATYIKGKPSVSTSFVPRGQTKLRLANSQKAEVVEEKIVTGAEEEFDLSGDAAYERTPSSFDRTVEPPYGEAPEVKTPLVWKSSLENGVKLYGIEDSELPLVQFNLSIRGGMLLEQESENGVANVMADLMTRGTATKTPAELEEAIDQLGARISINAGREEINISGTSLFRNFEETLALVQEMLLEPRWDEAEFEILKQQTSSRIIQQKSNPNALAQAEFSKLVFGKNSIMARPALGTESGIKSMSIETVKDFYNRAVSPSVAAMHVVGPLGETGLKKAISRMETEWEAKIVHIPNIEIPAPPSSPKIYFYDIPDAKQSQLIIGRPALRETAPDYYASTAMNYILGGGGFASQLTQELREGKGYTYGISSRFSGTDIAGTFSIASGVRTNVTLESIDLIVDILKKYAPGYSAEQLEATRNFFLKSNARAFETPNAKLGMLQDMSKYGWDADYVKKREQEIKDLNLERVKELAQKYTNPNSMYYVIVGDAKTQLSRLKSLGFGTPVLLNRDF